jgi:hypothetical protein
VNLAIGQTKVVELTVCRLAYRGGVTAGVTAPSGSFVRGLSTAFSLGAPNVLQHGSIQSDIAVHVAVTKNNAASVSTQIAALRTMLLGQGNDPMLSRVRAVRFFRPRSSFGRLWLTWDVLVGHCNPRRGR